MYILAQQVRMLDKWENDDENKQIQIHHVFYFK